MADIHYLHYRHNEDGSPGDQPEETACGIPAKDGQAYGLDGNALSLTCIPHAATCTPCGFKMPKEALAESQSKGGHESFPQEIISPGPWDPGNPG